MKNKLDPFAERLVAWRSEGRTISDMQKELLADGCKASQSSISEFLSARQRESDHEEFLRLVASGGEMNRKLDDAYSKNPDPEIGQLIRMGKTLVMTLQVEGAKDQKKLKMAKAWMDTILTFISGRTKAELEKQKLEQGERKLQLLEEKARKADAAEAVTGSNLSAEQKAERMREIFKK